MLKNLLKKIIVSLCAVSVVLPFGGAVFSMKSKTNADTLDFDDFAKQISEQIQNTEENIIHIPEESTTIINDEKYITENDFDEIINKKNNLSIKTNTNLNENSILLAGSSEVLEENKSISYQTVLMPLEDVATSQGYTVNKDNTGTYVSPTFNSKRLIVKSWKNIDPMGAIHKIEGFKNYHIFTYSTEEQAEIAYKYYLTLSEVEAVEPDSLVFTFEDVSTVSSSYLSWGVSAMGIDDYLSKISSNIGFANLKDVVVAVLDTGIDTDHTMFKNRIAPNGKNFVSTTSAVYEYEDDFGHGTHVSGIIAEATPSNVKILPIKVLDNSGRGYTSGIVLGLEYVLSLVENGMNIVSVNMSLGGAASSSQLSTYKSTIKSLISYNIPTVAASGNDNKNCSSVAPANIEECVTVSAVTQAGSSYTFASYSNYGTTIDFAAAGTAINGANIGGGTTVKQGTSMAAPHVTAIMTLFSLTFENMSVDSAYALLEENCIDLGAVGDDIYFGNGFIDISNVEFEVKEDVVFSNTTIDCTTSFELELSFPGEDIEIYYTLDGTTPNNTNGTLYTEPILINKTIIVKAIAYKNKDYTNAISKETTQLYRFSDSDLDSAYIYKLVDSETCELVRYDGVFEIVQIPELYNGKTVVSIGDYAFAGNEILTKVIMPSTITTIKTSAFYNCKNLESIKAFGVKVIESRAFANCPKISSLSSENFPVLEDIGNFAFLNHGLAIINLPNVKTIGVGAFKNDATYESVLEILSLENATIIKEEAFYNNKLLDVSTINMPKVNIIGKNAFYDCTSSSNLFTLNVEYIGTAAFYNSGIKNINLPNVKIIDDNVFYNDNTGSLIQSIDMPNVEYIGKFCFANSSLTSLSAERLKLVGEAAFYNVPLESLNTPSLESVEVQAFYNSNLSSINLPKLLYAEASAFYTSNTNLQVYLTDTVKLLTDAFEYMQDEGVLVSKVITIYANSGGYVQNYCESYADNTSKNTINFESSDYIAALKYLEIDDTSIAITGYYTSYSKDIIIPEKINGKIVKKISENAFKNCANQIILNATMLETIEKSAFENCTGIKIVELPSLITVENYAFMGASNLEYVRLEAVQNIGMKSFFNCPKLFSITLVGNVQSIAEKAIGFISETQTLSGFKVIANSYVLETYSNTSGLEFIPETIELSNSDLEYKVVVNEDTNLSEVEITSIKSHVIGSVIIPSEIEGISVKSLSSGLLDTCAFVTKVTLPNTITQISDGVFKSACHIIKISATNITTISASAFEGCLQLKHVEINGIKTIYSNAFSDCKNLTTINLSSASGIQNYAFYNCYALNFSEELNLSSLGDGVFNNCVSLENITINGVSSIADNVFANCYSLKSAYLPDAVKIGTAFINCTALENVNIIRVKELNGTFEGCLNLKEVNTPSLLVASGAVFSDCENLSSISASKVQTIKGNVFENCRKLTSLSFPALLELSENGEKFPFAGANGLTNIEMLSLKELGARAFAYCENIKVLYLPNLERIYNLYFYQSVKHYSSSYECNRYLTDIYVGTKIKYITNVDYPTGSEYIKNNLILHYYGENYSALSSYLEENGFEYIEIAETVISKDLPVLTKINIGETTTFSVSATGFNLGYQWYVNTVNSYVGATPLNGETSNTLSVTGTSLGQKYYFVAVLDWNGYSGSTNSEILRLVVMQDKNLKYSISFEIVGQGQITSQVNPINNSFNVAAYENFTLSFIPETYFVVYDVLVDGESVGSLSSYTFKNISKNHTLKITFVKEYFKVTLPSNDETKTINVTEFTGSKENVKYGSSYSFEIVIPYSYNKSQLKVFVNNEELSVTGTTYSPTDITWKYSINSITKDITITIQGIQKNSYKIQFFNTDGGIIKFDESEYLLVEYGETIEPPIISDIQGDKVYYKFDGWYKGSTNGTKVENFVITEDCNFYAKMIARGCVKVVEGFNFVETDGKNTSVTIKVSDLELNKPLKVETQYGSIEIETKTTIKLALNHSEITFAITKIDESGLSEIDKNAAKSYENIYSVSLMTDLEQINTLSETVKIRINYQLKEDQKEYRVKTYKLANGELVELDLATYSNGGVEFETSNFSNIIIEYQENSTKNFDITLLVVICIIVASLSLFLFIIYKVRQNRKFS